MNKSIYQEAILKHVRLRNVKREKGKRTNFVVEAVAGSGKSTTVDLAVEQIATKYPKETVLSLQFNKHIMEAMAKRLAKYKGVTVLTCHSAGLKVLSANGIKGKINGGKYYFLAKELVEEKWDRIKPGYTTEKMSAEQIKAAKAKATSQLTEVCKFAMSTFTDWQDLYALEMMCDKHDVIINSPLILDHVGHVMTAGIASAKRGTMISFDEMIYLPVYLNLKFPKYDWVLIDELQDLNFCQLKMVMAFVADDGVIGGFGDTLQAIMAFTGSMSDGMQMFKKLNRAKSLDLSICYRCSSSILDLARMLVPSIENRPEVDEGKVEAINKEAITVTAKPGDYIVCRITAPLISMCIQFIKKRIPAKVKGRDIGKKLVDLYEDVVKANPTLLDIDEFIGAFKEYTQEAIQRALVKKLNPSAMAKLEDEHDCINAIAGYISQEALANKKKIGHYQIKSEISNLFDDDINSSYVMLSTIHRTKGLEADNVFIIDFEKMPFQFPGTELSPEQYQQEKNLIYVAITRAKHNLYIQGQGIGGVNDVVSKLKGLRFQNDSAALDAFAKSKEGLTSAPVSAIVEGPKPECPF